MRLIIYNINSFGGNFEYSKYLLNAYLQHPSIQDCKLLMPANAEIPGQDILKILRSDISSASGKWRRKFYFIYRSVVNPFRLYKYLKKAPASIVIFNDYDQTTSLLWVPFFRQLKRKHRFAVILHDPDRDNFFSWKYLSTLTMKKVMSIMDIAFYHGYLPQRKYYTKQSLKIKVPHGIFDTSGVDGLLVKQLKEKAKNDKLVGMLGNIRAEKNYEIVMDSLCRLTGIKLLIAGNPANSSVSIGYYKEYAKKKGVEARIIWMIEYLSTARFNAAIAACDVILLYYKPSFTSHSGILNTIAPFKKRVIISDSESSLKETVVQYGLGAVVPQNDPETLAKIIENLAVPGGDGVSVNWNNYIKDSSWDKHVAIAVESFKKVS